MRKINDNELIFDKLKEINEFPKGDNVMISFPIPKYLHDTVIDMYFLFSKVYNEKIGHLPIFKVYMDADSEEIIEFKRFDQDLVDKFGINMFRSKEYKGIKNYDQYLRIEKKYYRLFNELRESLDKRSIDEKVRNEKYGELLNTVKQLSLESHLEVYRYMIENI